MSKPVKQTVYNVDRHVRRETHTAEEREGLLAMGRDRVAVAIGRQMLKRGLIAFDTEEVQGPNAGEKRIIVKGVATVNTPDPQE